MTVRQGNLTCASLILLVSIEGTTLAVHSDIVLENVHWSRWPCSVVLTYSQHEHLPFMAERL
jgi:hypothetical protein